MTHHGKDDNARLNQLWTYRYQCFCFFNLFFFHLWILWLAHFWFIRHNGETNRNKQFLNENNDGILVQIKVSRVLLQIEHYLLCIEGRVKLHIQSLHSLLNYTSFPILHYSLLAAVCLNYTESFYVFLHKSL